ncbi:hypothetical protein [Mesoterricola silvestris]|uniref:hypothetical protein n=1 Tax=Mesoterricola silvestris TaxID=2927979 RepID=UPI00292D5E34|nr:hypothetical protein [Mesoterricola silvestris]
MRVNRHIIIPIATAIIGGIVGGWLATRYRIKSNAETSEWRYCASTFERVRLLRQLRTAKNEEAIAEQEILLAGDITSLGIYVEHFKHDNPNSIEALRRASKYCDQFPPMNSNPEIIQAVKRAISLVKPK